MIMSAVILVTALSGCMDEVDDDWETSDELRTQLYYTSLDTDAELSLSGNESADMVLAYSADDTMNPYTCTSTLTQNICSLVYDSLINITPDFEVEYVIAKSITVDHTIITVQVKSGLVFSDGSELTGEDVSYSYYLASRSEGSIYAERLSGVASCSLDGMTVTFMMTDENVNAYRLLDFPIVKYDPSANTDYPPTGSGRYKFYTDDDGVPDVTQLVKNTKWYNPDEVQIETISLQQMPSVESIIHSVEIGTISYMYTDVRDGTPESVNADYRLVDINNLVYLGVNTNDTSLIDENVRKAINYAISTDEIASDGFDGKAVGATGPFTPNWSEAAQYQTGTGRSNVSAAQECLAESGYVIDNNGVLEDQDGNSLSFTLLVNKNNARHVAAAESVKSQLAEVGIEIEIAEVTAEGLVSRVNEGQYHLYLAEYSVRNDMDISELFTPGEGLYTGPQPYDCMTTYENYITSNGTLEDFISAFEDELPFIPLCYRMGMIIYARSLEGVGDVSESQPFYNMQDWYILQDDD